MSELDGYEDWPGFVTGRERLTGDAWTSTVATLLGVPAPDDVGEVATERSWTDPSGVAVSELSWTVGFGPRLHAWLVHPGNQDPAELPGVVSLPSHAGLKSVGGLRQVPLPAGRADPDARRARTYRDAYEGGVSFAARLAARGVAVLVPDAFSWGSRRFPLDPVPAPLARIAALLDIADVPDDDRYDELAGHHEHLLAKYAGFLATSYAGMVAHDDLTALAVLRRLCRGVVGVTGFSGGGGRAMTLAALDPVPRVSVVAMMATWESLVPDHVLRHSWLLHTPGLGAELGLPDLAATRMAHDLQVVYAARDDLFPTDGMRAADVRLERLFADAPGSYSPAIVDTVHAFPADTQDLVIAFLTAGDR